jgi:uncharacterized membrane protein YphA (DoxX/SURF4 family)
MLFCTFPDGRPGIGLLLLRATVGITAVVQGVIYWVDWGAQTLGTWVFGFPAVASGALLVIGFLTPITATLAGLSSIGIAFSWPPAPNPNWIDLRLVTFFVTLMAAVVVCLGPGAFSFDSCLFGRREIIIPPTSALPK